MSSTRLAAALVAALVSGSLLSAVVSAPSVAAPAPSARVKVTVVTPGGVPAAVTLKQKRTTRVVSKRARGKRTTALVRLRPGRATVTAPPITYRGTTYAATTPRAVTLTKTRTRSVKVVYRRLRVARDVRVGALRAKSVKVVWKRAPRGTRVVVRRTTGTRAVTSPRRGTAVKVRKNSATATRLTTGKAYTFTAFTMRRGRVLAAQSVTATPFRPGKQGGFVAPSTTRVHTNPKTAPRARARGANALIPAAGSQVGAGVVLPPSAQLPGGFIGVVDSITSDGRHAVLRPAAIDEVFDAVYGSGRIPKKSFPGVAVPNAAPGDTTWLNPSDAARRAAASGAQPTEKKSKVPACVGGSLQGESIRFKPTFTPTGTFDHGFSKRNILGKDFPTGAFVNASFNLNVEAPLTVKTTGTVRCGITMGPYNIPFQAGPLPMLAHIAPVAEFSTTGAVDIENVGYGGNVGAGIAAKFSLPARASVTGTRRLDMYPLTPRVQPKTGNFKVGLAVGADVIIGPGKSVGKDYGAVAGADIRLRVLDGEAGPTFPMGDSRHLKCWRLHAEGSVGVNLTAKAWYKNWDVKKTVELGKLPRKYGTKYFPENCEKEAGTDEDEFTEDVVVGDDVEIIEDELDGSEEQWGRTEAFTPGQGAWILSTGRMADIHGVGADFASTDLGLPGNERLSALSGFETHDAASYRLTLVPKKRNLHIRYLFASEEYPEYVGSEFNDVMAVFVDGQNCALVGGQPVSVNTINQNVNSDKYVPNGDGSVPPEEDGPNVPMAQAQRAASGTTSMDGWTVPLQCDVTVTPGKAVSVEVAVADSSDAVFDSAVALLDRGIWAD